MILMKRALHRMQRFRSPVLERRGSCICYLVILLSMPATADEPEFGLAIEKLEHLFEDSINVFEIEGTYGRDDSFVAMKVETEHEAVAYDASEMQLYYSRSIGSSVSGILGARYVHTDEDDDSSAMVGITAEAFLGIEVLMLAFLGGTYTEGRFELERPMTISPRTELVPKFEARSYSNDAETIAAEMRLVFATTDRLSTYVGASWSRVVGTSSDENGLTALAGLSYEW